jgi:cell division protease FtsH
VAELIVFNEVTTGAESDIEQLTGIARQMVGRWGMNAAIGPVSVIPRDGQGPLFPGAAPIAPETQRVLDEEVRRLVEECERDVRALIEDNRDKLDALVEALLDRETLEQDEAYRVAGVARPPSIRAEEKLETLSRDIPREP